MAKQKRKGQNNSNKHWIKQQAARRSNLAARLARQGKPFSYDKYKQLLADNG